MTSRMTRLFFLAIALWAGIWNLARAQVVINEIMYDLEGTDTDREWIEVLNSGSSAVDLSSWKFFEANVNHGLAISQGDASIPAGGFAIIADNTAKFLENHAGFSGALFDSSFLLSNTGEDLALKDISLTVVDQTTYSSTSGATGDGNSLQKINGNWIVATPTPGAANSAGSGGSGNDGGESSSGENSDSTTIPMVQPPPTPKITVDIISKISVVAGVPLYFSAKATGLSGEPLTRGKFLWSFGDGGSRESPDNYKFTHTYFYPGEYVVILEYSQSVYASAPDATDRLTIKVLPAGVSITSFGSAPDFPVELSNSATSEIDISGWVLQSVTKLFRLPQNTLMLPSKKIILSGRLTGFTVDDAKTLRLVLPSGDLVFDYGASLSPSSPPALPAEEISSALSSVASGVARAVGNSSTGSADSAPPSAEQTNLTQPDAQKFSGETIPEIINIEEGVLDQPAAVAQALSEESGKSVWPWLLGVAGVGVLGVAGVFLSRSAGALSSAQKPSDEFELLDE